VNEAGDNIELARNVLNEKKNADLLHSQPSGLTASYQSLLARRATAACPSTMEAVAIQSLSS
jgi:hypothetical protein